MFSNGPFCVLVNSQRLMIRAQLSSNFKKKEFWASLLPFAASPSERERPGNRVEG